MTDIAMLQKDIARAIELDRRHVFHSWSAQVGRTPMTVTRAEGSYVWDEEGKSLLDFTSQLVYTNLGHQHPRVVQAIQEQAGLLATVAPAHVNATRSEAARLIASHTPDGLDRIFFTNGGADANEHAIRMARLHTGRPKVLSRYRSYHGGTQLAVNVTGDPRRWPNDSGTQGVVHFFGPYLYRSVFAANTESEECERALLHLRQVIELEGPTTIAAIVLESIPGTAGIMVPPPGYLQGVRQLCDEYGIVLIADEVMAGFGRAGRWFAVEHGPVVPDLLTFAKGVNSGYVPLGGVAINEEIFASFAERPYPGGLTYSGHPLACAAAVAAIQTMEDEHIVDHADALGREVFAPQLAELAGRHDRIGDVRGVGAFWAVELVADRDSRTPLPAARVARVAAACRSQGLLTLPNANRIHLVPPLTASADEVAEAIAIFDTALTLTVGA
ncbi:aspartate aminotransferase family protein [Nocardia sp. NPDC059246]|uniref:aspartate aminotransferase family protein n=1 Tax=unclassified Nocardia TaxID=2637762 RepID=UPI00368A314E